MRFELFLIELPKAPIHKVQSALAELPKGASAGTIVKAMEARTIPTVSIAWSDDKRVLNEVLDTLIELGAGVKLVDHGSILQKLATFVAEKAGRARYLEDDDDPDSRKYIKLGQPKRTSLGEGLARHALIYLLQLCLASVLFVWFVALRVGMERVFSTRELMPQLAACALGLLVSYVCTASVRSVQAGRLSVPRILPQLILGGALTVGSFFLMGDGYGEEQLVDGTVKRPPSLPYAGLLSELSRRKAEREMSGRAGADEAAAELTDAAETEAELLWCEKPAVVEELSCAGGRAWEDASACLPKPEPRPWVATQRAARASRSAARAEPTAELLEPSADEATPVEGPWALQLGLSTVLTLAAMWLLSLIGLYLQLRHRARASAAPTSGRPDELSNAPQDTSLEVPEATQTSVERDALEVELAEAKTALAAALAETRGAQIADEEQFVNVQRELELSRGTLSENQVTIGDLKRELAQVREQLTQALEQRDQLRSTLLELRARRLDTRADNDGGERTAGLTRQPAAQEQERNTGLDRQLPERNTGLHRQLPERNTGLNRNLPAADEASYSSTQVQEERIQLGKRHKP